MGKLLHSDDRVRFGSSNEMSKYLTNKDNKKIFYSSYIQAEEDKSIL